MSTTDTTLNEMTESLTGFDEIAIDQAFQLDPYRDGERKPMLVVRALVFVHLRRQGEADLDARRRALEMPLREVTGYFAEDDELDPDGAPETPSGNGEGAPGHVPSSAPSSAS